MSSRHRLYLTLKTSFIKLFKTRAYYLKEQASKWSIFEKPYLDQDYRAMHLASSTPTWSNGSLTNGLSSDGFPIENFSRRRGGLSSGGLSSSGLEVISRKLFPAIVPEGTGGKIFWNFPNDCQISIGNGVCGESFSVGVRSDSGGKVYSVSSSDELLAKPVLDDYRKMELGLSTNYWGSPEEISKLSDPTRSTNGNFTFQVPEGIGSYPPYSPGNPEVVVTICISAQKTGTNTFEQQRSLLTDVFTNNSGDPEGINTPTNRQVERHFGEGSSEEATDCGCTDVTILCETCDDAGMAWDSGSDETVAQSSTAAVAVTDSTGKGGPYDWSVSGTDFTMANAQTSGLGNTLIAGAASCGSATITVIGCGGNSITNYVRSTSGKWVLATNCTIAAGGCACSTTVGNTLTLWWLRIGPTCIGGGTCGAATVCIACIGSVNPVNCKQLTYTWECL